MGERSIPNFILQNCFWTEEGCLVWRGPHDKKGYGTCWFGGRNYHIHRLVAHFVLGVPLNGHKPIVMHSCDNPPCCNPGHLVPGTNIDNLLDAHSKRKGMGRRFKCSLCSRLFTTRRGRDIHQEARKCQ